MAECNAPSPPPLGSQYVGVVLTGNITANPPTPRFEKRPSSPSVDTTPDPLSHIHIVSTYSTEWCVDYVHRWLSSRRRRRRRRRRFVCLGRLARRPTNRGAFGGRLGRLGSFFFFFHRSHYGDDDEMMMMQTLRGLWISVVVCDFFCWVKRRLTLSKGTCHGDGGGRVIVWRPR